jgi:hypothetical protein
MYITSSRIEDTESTSFDIQVILVISTITKKTYDLQPKLKIKNKCNDKTFQDIPRSSNILQN